jgi:hypothetical protein
VALVDGAQDRPAQVGDAADLVARQVDETFRFLFEQAVIAAPDAGDLPASAEARQRDGTNDGVQAGSIASAGVDQDVHVLKAISWLYE